MSLPNKIHIRPLSRLGALRDFCFSLIAGPLSLPLTHPWNRVRLPREQWKYLRDDLYTMVALSGDPDALKGNHPIRSHIRFLGGWKEYVVLRAAVPWHVGWIVSDGMDDEICEVSRIVIDGWVKMLLGPYQTKFFAIEADSGNQIFLDIVTLINPPLNLFCLR